MANGGKLRQDSTLFSWIYLENIQIVFLVFKTVDGLDHVKLIVCTDQHSVDLYKITISRIGQVWSSAKLEVVNEKGIAQRPRARTLLPAEPYDPQTILEVIRSSKQSLNTDN